MKQGIWNQDHIGDPLFDGLTLGGVIELADLDGGVFSKADYPGLRAVRAPDGTMTLARDLADPYTPPSSETGAPAGTVSDYAGSTVPEGWVTCDGAAISRTDYAALFAALGTTHGAGDGSTTFNVPDLRDLFVVGAGSTYALADTGGAAAVALATADLPSHTHGVGTLNIGTTGSSHTHTVPGKTGLASSTHSETTGFAGTHTSTGAFNLTTSTTGSTHDHNMTGSTAATGSGDAHENRPPYYALTKIVATGIHAGDILELWY